MPKKVHWGRLGMWLAVAITCLAMVGAAIKMNDNFHLIACSPYYAAVIYLDNTGGDVSFDWGVAGGEFGFFDFETALHRTLIYDRTGDMARRIGKVFTSESGHWYTTHLLGRFYIRKTVIVLH